MKKSELKEIEWTALKATHGLLLFTVVVGILVKLVTGNLDEIVERLIPASIGWECAVIFCVIIMMQYEQDDEDEDELWQ